MANEIERRFLLRELPNFGDLKPSSITQAYWNDDPKNTTRVRVEDDVATLTLKGPKHNGIGSEYEQPWPMEEVLQIIKECGPDKTIDKDRYVIPAPNNLKWEIDAFKGRHAGLIVAEIELPSIDTPVDIPHWIDGVEITEDKRFANSALTKVNRNDLLKMIDSVLIPAGYKPLEPTP